MTSQAYSSWDFEPIYNLIETFKNPESLDDGPTTPPCPPSLSSPPRIPSPSGFDPKIDAPQNLGDFNRLYQFLGLSLEDLPSRQSYESSVSTPSPSWQDVFSQGSTRSTPQSSKADVLNVVEFDDLVDRRVHRTEERNGTGLAELGSHIRSYELSHTSSHIKNSADFDSETDTETFQRHYHVVPLCVTPQPKIWLPPLSEPPNDSSIIRPIQTLTVQEKRKKLKKKLKKTYGYGSDINTSLLHVFVDCSNIIIGFQDALKIKRGFNVKTHTKQPPLSWHSLATILERGRPAARRVLVGSRGSAKDDEPAKLPDYMVEAETFGYELNIMDRVFKYKSRTPLKKKVGGNGYATASGFSSGSEVKSKRLKVVAEQGVDELLHMKMLESLVDISEPATIVLATGDAAEAEYSGGFFQNVERALRKGWKVELVSWSAGLSSAYRSKSFQKEWRGKFTIIELDDFSEELLAMYTVKTTPQVIWP